MMYGEMVKELERARSRVTELEVENAALRKALDELRAEKADAPITLIVSDEAAEPLPTKKRGRPRKEA